MTTALEALTATMTEEERNFTLRVLRAVSDLHGRDGKKVSARRVALILKTLGEDLERAEQELRRRGI